MLFRSFALTGRKTTDPKYHKNLNTLTAELKRNWQSYQINHYYILDDTFNETTDKLRMVQQAILDSGVPNFRFFAYLRLDLLRQYPEQIQILKDMGLQAAKFGIETLNDPSLKAIGKPLQSRYVKDTLYDLKASWGEQVFMSGSFIIGLPYETRETVAEWFSWLTSDNCPLDNSSLHHLIIDQANPSPFGKDVEKFGYRMISTPGNTGPLYNWVSDYWSKEDCKELAKTYNRKLFLSRKKIAEAWEVLGVQDIGHSFDWARTTPALDRDVVAQRALLDKQREHYIKELCEYEGIEL